MEEYYDKILTKFAEDFLNGKRSSFTFYKNPVNPVNFKYEIISEFGTFDDVYEFVTNENIKWDFCFYIHYDTLRVCSSRIGYSVSKGEGKLIHPNYIGIDFCYSKKLESFETKIKLRFSEFYIPKGKKGREIYPRDNISKLSIPLEFESGTLTKSVR